MKDASSTKVPGQAQHDPPRLFFAVRAAIGDKDRPQALGTCEMPRRQDRHDDGRADSQQPCYVRFPHTSDSPSSPGIRCEVLLQSAQKYVNKTFDRRAKIRIHIPIVVLIRQSPAASRGVFSIQVTNGAPA